MNKVPNKPVLDEIQSLIDDNQLSFLIGAGFSKNISKKFPLWKELLDDAIWNMFGTGKEKDRLKKRSELVERVLKEHSLLEIASKVVVDAGYHEAIDDYIEAHTPYLEQQGKKTVLKIDGVLCTNELTFDCHKLLSQLNVANIYTFNYDNALEFCLGDKKYLQEKKHTIQCNLEQARQKVIEIETQIRNYKEKTIPNASIDASVGPVSLMEEGSDNSNIEDERKKLFDIRNERVTSVMELELQESAVDKQLEQSYLVVKQASDIALTSSGHNIYKIHGDLRISNKLDYGFDGDKHAQYIITKEDYNTYEAKHAAFVNLMRIDLLRNRFCIIGVAGGDANFLAWINWVKDVLDKTGREANGRDSFFIYAGNDDLSGAMKQMLRNHFIIPVVLKDIFPKAIDEIDRVKQFLEYIQPHNTRETERLSGLWREVDRNSWREGKRFGLSKNDEVDELCKLSASIIFHKAGSIVHTAANDVQNVAYRYLKDISNVSRTKIYAAALRCSLLPLWGSEAYNVLSILKKSKSSFVEESYKYSLRRMLLLTNPSKLSKNDKEEDGYSGILKRLYLFDFPAGKECVFNLKSGLDYVRLFSLQKMLYGHSDVDIDASLGRYSSPQEQVLVSDWLACLDPSLKNKIINQARKYKNQYSLFSLTDYFKSYLNEVFDKKDVPTYGNVEDIIDLSGRDSGFESAAVILNSIIELGITFNGRNVLNDEDWTVVACKLKSEYPYPIVFYTIARESKDYVIKRISQEIIYDEKCNPIIPDLLKCLLMALVSENTPKQLIPYIAIFAQQLFVAVPVRKWGHTFKQVMEYCLDYADKGGNILQSRTIYQFASVGIEYINDKTLKMKCIERVLNKLTENEYLDNQLNSLAISASRGLTVNDFEPLADKMVAITLKQKIKRVDTYVLINLAHLLSKEYLSKIRVALMMQALHDANLSVAYAVLIRKDKKAAIEYKKDLLSRTDVWQSGIWRNRIAIGNSVVKISRIDKLLHFNNNQVVAIYQDMKSVINAAKVVFEKPGRKAFDRGWWSAENTFREVAIDMLIFLSVHKKNLHDMEDFDDVNAGVSKVYSYCNFKKTILQLLADDKTYIAIRCLMTQLELYGIDGLKAEYEALLTKMLTRSAKELNICFQHVSWVVQEKGDFFETSDLKTLLVSVLDSYAQYFVEFNQRSWDVAGCEKETAEKYLLDIAKTLERRGFTHVFWGGYKRRYYLK